MEFIIIYKSEPRNEFFYEMELSTFFNIFFEKKKDSILNVTIKNSDLDKGTLYSLEELLSLKDKWEEFATKPYAEVVLP